jgi:hypothetical protein
MKIVFLKLSLILAITSAAAGFLFGFIVPRRLIASGDGYIDRWHEFYSEKTNADIVCLGSSRVHRHFDPSIIDSITHLKTEVVATAGAQFNFYGKLYEDYLKRNPKPKLLIIGIDLTGLGVHHIVPNPEYFFPFIRPSDAVASFDEFNFIKYCKPLGYFYYKDIYYEKITNPEQAPHKSGYSPRNEPWDNEQEPFIGKFKNGFNLEINDQIVQDIFEFLLEQKKEGVKCIGVIAPEYYPVWKIENNRELALEKLYAMSIRYDVPIINFSDSAYTLCFNKSDFYNSEHLNKVGAEIFSRDLADSINKYYH